VVVPPGSPGVVTVPPLVDPVSVTGVPPPILPSLTVSTGTFAPSKTKIFVSWFSCGAYWFSSPVSSFPPPSKKEMISLFPAVDNVARSGNKRGAVRCKNASMGPLTVSVAPDVLVPWRV
jgi:hypothetical protein